MKWKPIETAPKNTGQWKPPPERIVNLMFAKGNQVSDIVKRLRERAGKNDEYGWHVEIELEAADTIERLAELLIRARECAEWHIGDRDDCGTRARALMADIDVVLDGGTKPTYFDARTEA